MRGRGKQWAGSLLFLRLSLSCLATHGYMGPNDPLCCGRRSLPRGVCPLSPLRVGGTLESTVAKARPPPVLPLPLPRSSGVEIWVREEGGGGGCNNDLSLELCLPATVVALPAVCACLRYVMLCDATGNLSRYCTLDGGVKVPGPGSLEPCMTSAGRGGTRYPTNSHYHYFFSGERAVRSSSHKPTWLLIYLYVLPV